MSYRTVPATKVKKAATLLIAAFQQAINEEIEPLIEEAMKGSWLRGSRTREEAISHLEKDRYSRYYALVNFRNWKSMNRAKQLIALCDSPSVDGMINLDADDAAILADYFVSTPKQLNG